MTIADIIQKIKGMTQREPQEELPDDMTRDKYLRSLRRERRMQLEELEKKHLQKQIADFKKAKAREHLWGVKDTIDERKMVEARHKKIAMLNAKKIGLKRGKVAQLKSQRARTILQDNSTMLGRSRLI